MAGGRGTRLAGIVDGVPKPMVTIAGRPFLAWGMAWLVGQGVADIVLSVGYLGDQIEAWLTDLRMPGARSVTARRESSPLGTGGAVLSCLDLVRSDTVLVVNGDTLLLAQLKPILARLEGGHLDGVVLAVQVADAGRFGTLRVDQDGLLAEFREKQPGAGLVNAGTYAFRREALARFLPPRPMSLEADVIPELLRTGARIGVAVVDAPFIDIGVPESLRAAEGFVATHRATLDRS